MFAFGSNQFKMADGGTATGESNVIETIGWQDINVQVWGITANSATVQIKGRIHENAPWLTLATLTNVGSYHPTGSYSHLMVNVSAYTSGTVGCAVCGVDLYSLLKR